MGDNRAALEGETEQYLFFREAVCWIAFGSYDFPPIGPRDYFDFLVNDAIFEAESQSNQGRFELAHDQLVSLIARGEIKIFGRPTLKEANYIGEGGRARVSRSIEMPAIEVGDLNNLEIYEDDGGYYVGNNFFETLIVAVRALEQRFLPLAQSDESAPITPKLPGAVPQETDFSPLKKRGRPRLHDWDWVMQEIVLLANEPDGLPATQAELEAFVAQKFISRYGQQPADSNIRKKVGPIYQRLRSKSQ